MTKAMWNGVLAAVCAFLAPVALIQAKEDKAPVAPAARADEDAKPQPYLVVVGVGNYPDKQIQSRPHAEDDAKALFDLFTDKDNYGVDAAHARLLLGAEDAKRGSQPATRENILKAVQWIAKEAGPKDPVIFAFFGEGAPLGDLGDRHCYLAVDSTFKGRDKDAIGAAEISEAMKGFKSQDLAVFLDVNFKGFTPPADSKPIPEATFTDKPFAEFRGDLGSEEGQERTPGRVVFLANRPTSASLDGPDHGIFATALLDALKGAADTDGKEADGLVTVDELAEYLDKQIPELARKYGKTDKEKEQVAIVLGSPNTHFVLSHNAEPYKKAQERLAKFEQLVKDGKVSEKVAEEGRQFLGRMPKLEAQRELRKDYQKLADGDMKPEEFVAARTKVLEGTKLGAAVAEKFAAKVIDATEVIQSDYYKEENQDELAAQGVRKLYKFVEEKIPDAIEARLEKVKDLNEDQLKELLIDARAALGKREDLDKDKDIDVALVEMLRTLDPYTTYIDPDTLKRFQQEVQGVFTGIGIQIRKDASTDLLLVVTPIKGSPAYKAGLLAGDLITKITREVDSDGNPLDKPEVTDTKGLVVGDAVKKILGQPDTKVKLTIQREGVEGTKEYEITRGRVEVETVFGVKRRSNDDWDFMLDKEKKIGYLRLSQFQEDSYNDIVAAMQDLKKQGVKGFILDLRFNPGGLLTAAVDISDLFMDDGVIVSIRPRGKPEEFIRGKHEGSLLGFPMVCMVNGDSASASEIVSACLQDHHRAYIVGERSFGKGSVQNIRKFGDGQMKLTTATFWRPSGKNLYKRLPGAVEKDEWGVKPDLVVPMTEKERGELFDHLRNNEVIPRRDAPPKAEKDPKPEFKDVQLEQAVDYLTGQLKTAANNPVKKAG